MIEIYGVVNKTTINAKELFKHAVFFLVDFQTCSLPNMFVAKACANVLMSVDSVYSQTFF